MKAFLDLCKRKQNFSPEPKNILENFSYLQLQSFNKTGTAHMLFEWLPVFPLAEG